MHFSYGFDIPMKEKSAENIVQAYLSDIFTIKEAVKQSLVIMAQS